MKTPEQIADELVERFGVKFPYTPKKSLVECAIICVEENIKLLLMDDIVKTSIGYDTPCEGYESILAEQKEVLTILKSRL